MKGIHVHAALVGSLLVLAFAPRLALSNDTIDDLMTLSFEELVDYEIVTPTQRGVPLSPKPGCSLRDYLRPDTALVCENDTGSPAHDSRRQCSLESDGADDRHSKLRLQSVHQ